MKRNGGSSETNRGRIWQDSDPVFPRLLGERLCLDFANTVEPRTGSSPEEFLRDYSDLVGWGRHVGVFSAAQARRLLAEGECRPEIAVATFARALALREAIYRVFRAVAHGDMPAPGDLATVHEEHLAALARARLVATGAGVDLAWSDDEPSLDRVLWPVARSAVDLLVGRDSARIKECRGPDGGCGWLFYDVSKNASRRWCSMEGCGSVAKMRRYRARRHAARPGRQGSSPGHVAPPASGTARRGRSKEPHAEQ